MKLKLHISPCPNDTYMFNALINNKMDLGKLQFTVRLSDIEELNKLAINNIPDITKISYGVYGLIAREYQLLPVGSAMGFGAGPLLVAKRPIALSEITSCTVAIPGQHTSANMLFDRQFPEVKQKRFMVFSAIGSAILKDQVDAGVIIHESRFTYQHIGLQLVADLGKMWEEQTGLPVPLGAIAVRRTLPEDVKKQIAKLLKQSILQANQNPSSTLQYVQKHAQEMSPEVQMAHIKLYVNDYSLAIDNQAQRAVECLLKKSLPAQSEQKLPYFVQI